MSQPKIIGKRDRIRRLVAEMVSNNNAKRTAFYPKIIEDRNAYLRTRIKQIVDEK